jgi:hypothetical protein
VVRRLLKDNTRAEQIYVGLKALRYLCEVDRRYVHDHQVFIIGCLQSRDEAILGLTLDLLFKNISRRNVETIIQKFMECLQKTFEASIRKSLFSKIFQCVVQYCSDFGWFLAHLNELFEMADSLFD